MKKDEAILELNRQIDRLNDKNYPKNDAWTNKTATLIRKYFGEDSEQYKFLSDFKFLTGFITPDTKQQIIDRNKGRAVQYLKDCIEFIEKYGLYKRPRKNILSTIGNEWLVAILIPIAGALYGLGFSNGTHSNDVQNYELRQTVKSQHDTISKYKTIIDTLTVRKLK